MKEKKEKSAEAVSLILAKTIICILISVAKSARTSVSKIEPFVNEL